MINILIKTILDSIPMLALCFAVWGFIRVTLFVATWQEQLEEKPYEKPYKINIGSHKKKLSALE